MDNLNEYFKKSSKNLREEFEEIRKSFSDSDVKGGRNEKIVEKFLTKHLKFWGYLLNQQIIDPVGTLSKEVDIVISDERYTWHTDINLPQISESVACVIQVKASLDSNELERIKNNAQSVKDLKKYMEVKGEVYTRVDPTSKIGNEWLNKIPYVVFAFESSLKKETLLEKLEEIPMVDAIFVLDRGLIFINNLDGSIYRYTLPEGGKIKGWMVLETAENTVIEFIKYLVRFIPRFDRREHPLNFYFKQNLEYKKEE